MTRDGYLEWRATLKKFHAQKAGEILRETGYAEDRDSPRAGFEPQESIFPTTPNPARWKTRLCLMFLEYQFAELAARSHDDKMINALTQIVAENDRAGRAEALKLNFGPRRKKSLLERALNTQI